MTGLNKYIEKDKKRQRLRNHVARDLLSPKYRQRIVPRKRIEDEEGNYYYTEDE